MCRQCDSRAEDETCKDNTEPSEQNERAIAGLCVEAAILGGTYGLPYNRMAIVLGDMKRLENGDWIFEGRNYNRTSKD